MPAANIIGGEGNGFKTVLGAMNAERVLIAAECIGDGRFFIDRATQYLLHSTSLMTTEQQFCIGVCTILTVVKICIARSRYAKDRHVFGRPIGANQGIAFPIAEAYAEIEAAALMVNHAADLIDGGATAGEQANLAKYLAAEASVSSAAILVVRASDCNSHAGFFRVVFCVTLFLFGV